MADVLNTIRSVESRIDNRFTGVETRLGGIETRLDGIETRLDGIETSIEDMAEQNKLFRDNTAEKLACLHDLVEECACRCPRVHVEA
jgi:archaellum component FlaC